MRCGSSLDAIVDAHEAYLADLLARAALDEGHTQLQVWMYDCLGDHGCLG